MPSARPRAAGTQGGGGPHSPGVTHYAYAIKALPIDPGSQVPEAPPGSSGPPSAEPDPPHDDARPWAGDAYDEGDETDPSQAFAAFTGQDGEEAWLDRAPDGTLTGWVRDATGQVWRYTDDSAWALDVDGAQMQRVGGNGAPAPADESGGDSAEDPPAGGEPDPYAASDEEPAAGDEQFTDESEAGEPPADDEQPDGENDEEESEAPFPGAKKPKKKGGR